MTGHQGAFSFLPAVTMESPEVPRYGDPLMQIHKNAIPRTFLCLLVLSIVVIPAVTAAPATTTVPAISCTDPAYPDASFTYNVISSETAPISVQFTDQSTAPAHQPIATHLWDFGDGATSSEKSPRHTFAEGNWVTVKHTVETVCGKRSTVQYHFDVYCTRPTAGFTSSAYDGVAPLTVQITDTSQHTPASESPWYYAVRGGTHDLFFIAQQNPVITLDTPGIYIITQTVQKTCNPDEDTYAREVRVVDPASVTTAVTTTAATPVVTTTGVTLVTTTTIAPPATTPVSPALSTTVTTATVLPTTLTYIPATQVPAAGTASTVAGTGTLSVTTTPAGAQVYLDDILRGASPATIPGLAAGSHILRLEKSGYRNMTVPVEITTGKTTDYTTALVPEDGNSGLVLLIGAVFIIVIGAGAAAWYLKTKGTIKP